MVTGPLTPDDIILSMEGLGVAANIIAVIELSAKVASLCLDYSRAVKDAKEEITRLQTKVKELEEVAKDVQQLIDQGGELSTSRKLEQAVFGCYTQIQSVEKRLDLGKRHKVMRRFGVRALKWPFESNEVDKIIRDIENYNSIISLALQVDQT